MKPCGALRAGKCRRGAACPNWHDPLAAVKLRRLATLATQPE
eukprot:gene5503-8420_t